MAAPGANREDAAKYWNYGGECGEGIAQGVGMSSTDCVGKL